eukprot:XP_015584325.1 uncharacterized protein LOC107262641 [Ricinus communis]
MPLKELTEMEQEAMCEIGNIMLNSCVGTLANIFQRELQGSLPRHERPAPAPAGKRVLRREPRRHRARWPAPHRAVEYVDEQALRPGERAGDGAGFLRGVSGAARRTRGRGHPVRAVQQLPFAAVANAEQGAVRAVLARGAHPAGGGGDADRGGRRATPLPDPGQRCEHRGGAREAAARAGHGAALAELRRRPDRHRQPPPFRRGDGKGAPPRQAGRHAAVAADDRHRPLQGLQ